MQADNYALDTRLIHAGEPETPIEGAVSMPVFQSSTYTFSGEGGYHDLGYIRLSNTPNHDVLNGKLASLEGAQAALVTGSGMAAITTTLLSVLRAGDHLLVQDTLYGGTHDFLTHDLEDVGIGYTFIDGDDPASWPAAMKENTRAIYVETIANPLMTVSDLEAVVPFARENGLVSIIDSTFATPVNFRPLALGFDLVVHSATKYLNGHTDIVAGVVAGAAERVRGIRLKLNHLGGVLDPHACFLLHRGLKTLGLRVRHQNASAARIAAFLEDQPGVAAVNYPGLASHRHHQRAARLFEGCGGMLSFELDGDAATARRFIAATRLPYDAPSLGGTETLLTMPALTSHAGLDPEVRRAIGISDSLIRMSVGLEDAGDLIADLGQALESARALR